MLPAAVRRAARGSSSSSCWAGLSSSRMRRLQNVASSSSFCGATATGEPALQGSWQQGVQPHSIALLIRMPPFSIPIVPAAS
jgi:hypothetical protein